MLGEIEDLQSFVSMELFVTKGGVVRKTIDCFTFGGVIRLIHDDPNTIETTRYATLKTPDLFCSLIKSPTSKAKIKQSVQLISLNKWAMVVVGRTQLRFYVQRYV